MTLKKVKSCNPGAGNLLAENKSAANVLFNNNDPSAKAEPCCKNFLRVCMAIVFLTH
jgi:hypothetical protein